MSGLRGATQHTQTYPTFDLTNRVIVLNVFETIPQQSCTALTCIDMAKEHSG